MGQYYLMVNLAKRQYLMPHRFGDGLKLLEFACSADGTMTALAILLADGNNRGGGDLMSDNPIIGSWAGDRIVIAGDYADAGKFLEGVSKDELQPIAERCFTEGHQWAENVNLYAYAEATFQDVSDDVIQAMLDDQYLADSLRKTAKGCKYWAGEDGPLAPTLKQLV